MFIPLWRSLCLEAHLRYFHNCSYEKRSIYRRYQWKMNSWTLSFTRYIRYAPLGLPSPDKRRTVSLAEWSKARDLNSPTIGPNLGITSVRGRMFEPCNWRFFFLLFGFYPALHPRPIVIMCVWIGVFCGRARYVSNCKKKIRDDGSFQDMDISGEEYRDDRASESVCTCLLISGITFVRIHELCSLRSRVFAFINNFRPLGHLAEGFFPEAPSFERKTAITIVKCTPWPLVVLDWFGFADSWRSDLIEQGSIMPENPLCRSKDPGTADGFVHLAQVFLESVAYCPLGKACIWLFDPGFIETSNKGVPIDNASGFSSRGSTAALEYQ